MADVGISLPDEGTSQPLSTHTDASNPPQTTTPPDTEAIQPPVSAASAPSGISIQPTKVWKRDTEPKPRPRPWYTSNPPDRIWPFAAMKAQSSPVKVTASPDTNASSPPIIVTASSVANAPLPPVKVTTSSDTNAPSPLVKGTASADTDAPSPPVKVTASDTDAPSPYGTRSRNRTGTARPNYAEDRETEMDYEYASSSKHHGLSTTISVAKASPAESDKPTGVSTRRTSGATAGIPTTSNGSAASVAHKDYIPGMSTFSANPNITITSQPSSKKRKAPGGAPISTSHHTANPPANGGQTITRRASSAVSATGGSRETNMLSFENCQGYLKNGKLKADDGATLNVNDNVYLVCEPPGEPYYLARIMEFLHADNDPNNPVDALRVNWYYRPRDIQRKVTDTRLVFASMHSDTCPLTSLRGKCRIQNRNEIDNVEEYRKTKDCFWYEKLYDRYIQRYYEVIPTSQVINVPEHVKKVLDERWKFVIVEIGRGKELTSAVKNCKRCGGYCASHDSVDCAVCRNTYHMNCVRPPLLKKPARGFAWACGPCSQAQERKLEARNTPILGEQLKDVEEEEIFEEEDDDLCPPAGSTGVNSPAAAEREDGIPRTITANQIAQAKMWPYRYLGIHCRVEDALDYDDRIYPRASSRLGPRHQANVNMWHGRPVEYVKPAEIKRRYIKGSSHKKDAKLSKETIAALEADKAAKEKRPKWVMDEPVGYVRRGEDHANSDPNNTAKLMFRMPDGGQVSPRGGDDVSNGSHPAEREGVVDLYMTQAKTFAKEIGVEEYSTNFLDKALELLYTHNYDAEAALEKLRTLNRRKDLREPELNKEEIKRFEEGVSKYGSEMRLVRLHVRTQKHADIVRFYYMWKKTDRGKQIWGNYEARKSKKQAKQVDANAAKLLDDVADDVDDSAFDNAKAAQRKRGFKCKFCSARTSRQWRRAPNTAPGTMVPPDLSGKSGKDKGAQLVLALCQRCAGLWRKYGIHFENVDEVAKKVASGGGKAWKKKIDVELLTELYAANEANDIFMSEFAISTAASIGVPVLQSVTVQAGQEPSKKKLKTGEKDQVSLGGTNGVGIEAPKKKVVEKVPEPPLIPEQPKPKVLPCAICLKMEPMGDQHLSCRDCRLTVHRNCYGVGEDRSASKWICDMCTNDRGVQISTSYECVLCPVRHTEHEFVEPPKVSHKKKSDREREKERLEREMAVEAAESYRQKQAELGRPLGPREALKRTAGNNWLHVVCAIWTPEIRFGNAKALAPSEGIGSIPTSKYEQLCKLCQTTEGACVACYKCHAPVHVGCAQKAGYSLGFEVTPVKGSRRDTVNTVSLGGETGNATAVVWCKEHPVLKTIIHPMSEVVDNGSLNALQLFVRNYKQADLTLAGTVRKANLVSSSTRPIPAPVASASARRASAANGTNGAISSVTPQSASRSSRISPTAVTVKSEEIDVDGDRVVHLSDGVTDPATAKHCITCGTDASPKWHKSKNRRAVVPVAVPAPFDEETVANHMANGCHVLQDIEANSRPEAACAGPTALTNGHLSGDDNKHNTVYAAAALRVETRHDPDGTAGQTILFQCHKCHLKKLTEPSPPETPTVPPSIPPQVHQEPASQPPHPPPPAQLIWPPAPHMAPQGHFQVWTNPGVPMQNGQPMLQHMEQTASHQHGAFVPGHTFHPPALPQQLNGFAPQAQVVQPQYPVNSGAAPYQFQRHGVPQLVPSRHPPPSSHHGLVAQAPQHITNGVSTPHPPYQPSHLSNGHPAHRTPENPFTGPPQATSHAIPPLASGHVSPHMIRERPSTPMETGGAPRPGSAGRIVNGASASPSLRNLLS